MTRIHPIRRLKTRRLDLDKVTVYAIVVNALQIVAVLVIFGLSLLSGGHAVSGKAEQGLLLVVALVVVWGAVLDIREAFSARRMGQEADMLEDAYGQLEDLNVTMRAQRHDFMNHLQVVFSLLELKEYPSAMDYIERVYGDIQKVGRTLKTALPALNALLAAKLSDCESRGIALELDIRSAWQQLPLEGWEMCRVLSNLIDNAMDALRETSAPRVTVRMWEDLHAYHFSVENNGPRIPRQLQGQIFETGFTTKRTGHGMGLSIVRDILREGGGDIKLYSDLSVTRFTGFIPKNIEETLP